MPAGTDRLGKVQVAVLSYTVTLPENSFRERGNFFRRTGSIECARKSPPDHLSATSCLLKGALEVFASAVPLYPLQIISIMRMTETGKHTLRRGAAKYLALAFALIFLVFESSTLVHSHAGDLNKHLDCTFCLKIGADDDVLPAENALPLALFAHHVDVPVLATSIIAEPATARSRSPPYTSVI